VKLISTSDFGCADSLTKTVFVFPQPQAGFTVNNASQCLKGNYFLFTDTSSITNGTLFSSWKFGNTDTSSANQPSILFNSAKTYPVKLISTSDKGCKDSITNNIIVNPQPGAAVSARGATTFCFGNEVRINADTGTNFLYRWQKNGTDSLGDTLSEFVANTAGNYSVIVKTKFGCSDTSNSINVFVNPLPPATATASGQTTFCNGDNVAIRANYDTGLTYQWLYNGVNIPGANKPEFNAIFSGNFAVVTKNYPGCQDTSQPVQVTMFDFPERLPISGSTQVSTNDTVSYSFPFQSGYSYNWTATNGKIISGQHTNNIVVKWYNSTNGKINLVVLNNSICTDTQNLDINILNIPNGMFLLFPNPAFDFIILKSVNSLQDAQLNICDMLGKIIMDEIILSDKTENRLDLTGFSSGCYLLSVQNNEGTKVKMFVKQ
ncbi:MAG: T9SS type A sorting domain-containing protein, partial [Bacteroidia bacterium]